MLGGVNLRKTGQRWEFESEAALEDVAWANLERLFGLTPLKRQYSVKGQICDILAVDENKRLVVLELKNTEDRYIVQQLTRYYDALLEEKPFKEQVDYAQPIGLMAITPIFHKDNFTDRKYNHLSLRFLQVEIFADGEKFYLQLKDIDTGQVSKLEIPHQATDSTESIPIPPKALQKLLSGCTPEQLEVILRIRNQILSFDKRIEEMPTVGSIKYGNGNSKQSQLCAEFYSDSKGSPLLFLWLPKKGLTSKIIGRTRIWTDWNGNALVEGYVSRGIGTKITSDKKVIANRHRRMKEIKAKEGTYWTDVKYIRQYVKDINRIRRKISDLQPVTYEEIKYIEAYIEENDNVPYKSLDSLVDIALEKWRDRL